ncbi:type II toxin-antitoxin system VapC family toxin [Actinomycetes bacterium KLBMP 9759]
MRASGSWRHRTTCGRSFERHEFDELPLTIRHALGLRDLPLHHRDPVDRLLIAQARAEGLTSVTADRSMTSYDVPVLAAASLITMPSPQPRAAGGSRWSAQQAGAAACLSRPAEASTSA